MRHTENRQVIFQTSLLLAGLLIPIACGDGQFQPVKKPAREEPENLAQAKPADEAASQRFAPNDVSLLFPARITDGSNPTLVDSGAYLRLDAVGAKGVLAPSDLRRKLIGSTDDLDYRVLGARVDPCFRLTDGGCQRQIRLVAQRFKINDAWVRTMADVRPGGQEGAAPDALNFSYVLDEAEFRETLRDLARLKMASPVITDEHPLGVHPGLARAGINSAVFRQALDMILRHCGEANIVRGTEMTRIQWQIGKAQWTVSWGLAGAEGASGSTPTPIPGIPDNSQFMTKELPSIESSAPTLSALFDKDADDSSVDLAFGSSWRIDNPRLASTQNTACLDCHLGTDARSHAVFTDRRTPADSPDRYPTPNGTMAVTPRPGLALINFGYLTEGREIKASISDRTINETSEALLIINGLLTEKTP